MSFSTYAMGLLAILILTTGTWVISVIKRDVSIVDGMWPGMFLVAALASLRQYRPLYNSLLPHFDPCAVVGPATVSAHHRAKLGVNPRIAAIGPSGINNEPNFALKSLGIIFLFQGLLAWVISMPLWAALTVPVEIGPIDVLAITLWTVGMVFETVG